MWTMVTLGWWDGAATVVITPAEYHLPLHGPTATRIVLQAAPAGGLALYGATATRITLFD